MSSPAANQLPLLDLRIEHLQRASEVILGGVALRVTRGETVALTGPSGIGKTTILRVIAGLDEATQGQCKVQGKIAMVFQEPTLLPWRNLTQNICLTAGVTPAEADQWLADVGLARRGGDYPGQLSLGQERRLALARAFAAKPDLLLMDEPFVSLDRELADEMMALFEKLRDAHQVTTLLVTHVAEEAERLATRVITLGGKPARIISDAPVLDHSPEVPRP
ncbi:Aliphatic sulfonates import ATP-binding protein SsuB [Pelagimonas phthalicica]|uniref:Aliphatic sulfonates import ATP-binding protein SsuB n=1 Tax=Pelagimonas phthalicica TaxID=1037362 RepID=A0A238JF08_9RHOB|nr:ATP-binding cassette domain-containing protein [Pelagimonas phthalicica]TDS92187.1 NitT/TauT family transport system ATP-binding protein [Pelagimonas phthalicica]SMX29248.1 Aliphatic sulfonates import ATP-binding protein SsuB [Pelagimonas phthalicica]